MRLLKALLLLNSGQPTAPPSITRDIRPAFPTGHLTSNAWEGWWHDDFPSSMNGCTRGESLLGPRNLSWREGKSWNQQ